MIAGGATEFYFAFRDYPDKPNTGETSTALVAAGIGVSGGIACFVGMFLPGKPTALVGYYNRTNSRDQSLENQALTS